MEDKKTVNMIDERKVKRMAFWGGIALVLTGIGVYKFGYRNGVIEARNIVQEAMIKTLFNLCETPDQPKES